MTRRADLAVANYGCPVESCAQPPGRRCVRRGGANTRPLLHPHPERVALVRRLPPGASDAVIASWVRSHAKALRECLTLAAMDGAASEATDLLTELARLAPEQGPADE